MHGVVIHNSVAPLTAVAGLLRQGQKHPKLGRQVGALDKPRRSHSQRDVSCRTGLIQCDSSRVAAPDLVIPVPSPDRWISCPCHYICFQPVTVLSRRNHCAGGCCVLSTHPEQQARQCEWLLWSLDCMWPIICLGCAVV